MQNAARNSALDFTKGMLVLVMVLYHWINYFLVGQDNRYLRFLTPSFIFITGFIVSNIYLSKYAALDLKLVWRLTERGLKILGVFTFLNILRAAFLLKDAGTNNVSNYLSTKSLFDVFVVGTGVGGGDAKLLVFYILVPIGYLLILSAILVAIFKNPRYAAIGAASVALFLAFLLDFNGIQSPNLELIAVGLLGMVVGFAPIEKIDRLVRHPYILVSLYLSYLAAITIWNVIYPLQILGVCLSLMILYLLGQQDGLPRILRAPILLLGKYSLVGYIAQIVILQLLRKLLFDIDSQVLQLGGSFVLAFVLTISLAKIVDILRKQVAAIDKIYKAIFA